MGRLLLNLSCIILLISPVSSSGNFLFSSVLSQFITTFPNYKVFVAVANFAQDNRKKNVWIDKLESFLSSNVIFRSGGVTNLYLESSNNFSNIPIPRLPRTLSEPLHLVILLLPEGLPDKRYETILNKRLNLPLLNPPTIRNADKYVLISKLKYLKSLYERNVIRALKYKLFLTHSVMESGGGESITLSQLCFYCSTQEKQFTYKSSLEQKTTEWPRVSKEEYFPDLQSNYFGFTLRVSSTDKMEGDLEFAVDPRSGKTYGRRGVFAAAMYHLASGLNFTAELYRSTAGASTGHRLPNGTWVGSVGDVFNGEASFCMLCGMSYNRHFIVEICSPVTYEYIRFAIGPSEKLYTWQAIFWPFNGDLWISLFITICVITLCTFLFFKVAVNNSSWNIFTVTQYFGRIFIEQSQDLPEGLPQSIRITMGFWLLFALVGTTLYRAKMVTFMTFPVYEQKPGSYHELIHSKYEIEFHYFPNIAYNSFKSSTNPIMVEVFQKMLKQPDPVKCLQHTLSSRSVCIMFTSVHDDTISRNMSDRFGQSPIRTSSDYAFMFTPGISSQKRADFTPNFRKILQTSLQMGLNEWWTRSDAYHLLKLKNMWIKSLPPGGNHTGIFQYDAGDDDVLHLKHLKGAFTVLISGLLVAAALFILEQSGSILGRFRIVQERKFPSGLTKIVRILPVFTISKDLQVNDSYDMTPQTSQSLSGWFT